MDIKWKKYSHLVVIKLIAFIVAIVCFTSALMIFVNIIIIKNADFGIAFEESYFLGTDYVSDSSNILTSLRNITENYKSEEHILKGGSLKEIEIRQREENLFWDFQNNSRSYNPNLTHEENYVLFKEVYAAELTELKDRLITEELQAYNSVLRELEKYQGLIYYAVDSETVFTNSTNKTKDHFQSFPSYMVFDGPEYKVFPQEIQENPHYYWITSNTNQLGHQDKMYIAFNEEFLNSRIGEWKENKVLVTKGLYQITGFSLGLALAFIYLLVVIGRKNGESQETPLNVVDRIYNDFKIVICFTLIAIWIAAISQINHVPIYNLMYPVTLFIASLGLIFLLSFVKHLKNKTFLKHTLFYAIFYKIFKFIKEIYDSGSVGIKVVLIVIGYPVLVAITFFMFPITLGIAAWIALRKVKEFSAIKEGVKRVKEGDIHYTINVSGGGEFAQLAGDINSITDGLYKAVDNEIRSERLKTELITNVSHDIRTPLTSIITYVDLLKSETDLAKAKEYLEILDQKSQRLKTLTEDLFEASKASSGNIPVNFEEIDIESLITQGLGELDDKVQDRKLEFRINRLKDKVFIKADGKLLWRAIENLLSNIFKYALEGSRVYIDIIDSGTGVMLIIKNISAYELNISSEELMERFKRGDESRSSQGSGLGLSIAKSLVEIQKGSFDVEIDGDLFKAIIHLPK
ncbi:HAMP domain-containing sensor histidine kinase [Desulfosporosinus sp.]|uniref:HAMP domain-containing sensor histidine kinase n=1 Tax=Desulfosporosinus sp. TaxID=157907 RepID=UPI0025C2E99D|nr:HAMP domain-containing sensor histidine kinase [Desulfosporosinus sp.]MBC2728747.1 HAMP domain-containing histidine kinase [Desulfosporosinus sp.]